MRKYRMVRIALDEINAERGIGNSFDRTMTPNEWQETYDIYHERIAANLHRGHSVIVDTVGHTREGRDGLREIAQEHNAEAVVLYLATPLAIAEERWLNNRKTKERADVRDDDFYRVVNNFEIPGDDEHVKIITPDMNIQEVYGLIEQ